ncbi:MAG TPA: hypothetical protein VFV08_04665, partial [Puia sp.]|nr:hypothetical protein [Puia sp.]
MNKQSKYIAIGIGIVVAGGLVYLVVKRTGVLKNTGASYTGAPQNVGINPNQGPLSNPGSAGGTSSLIGKAIYTNRNDVVIRSSPTIDDGWLFNNVGYSVPAAGTWIGAVTE